MLNHTVACSDTFSLEAKHCYSFDDVTGQLAPFFATARPWPRKGLRLRTIKIRRRLAKVTKTQFFRSVHPETKNIYINEKNFGG